MVVLVSTDENKPNLEMTMTDALQDLIAKAQKVKMDDEQMREQRLSFVYGNTHIENDRITREMVIEADKKVSEEDAEAAKRLS